MEIIEVTLAHECAEENLKKLVENFGSFAKSEGASVNVNGLWKVKTKVYPKNAKFLQQ